MDRPIRVFVVDDHAAYRRVVGAVVGATPGFELVGAANDVDGGAAELSDGDGVDLVLVDVNLGDGSGLDLAATLTEANPDLRVALISTLAADELPPEAPSCGAFAFLPKGLLSPATLQDLEAGLYDWGR